MILVSVHSSRFAIAIAFLVVPVGNTPSALSQNRVAPTSSSSPKEPAAMNSPSDLAIGEGDLLQVSLYGVPDFNQQVRVAPSGDISLPMIGDVRVKGLTSNQVEMLIEKDLKEGGYFVNPQVTVLQKELATQGISVLGEVQKPGIYPALGPRKLFDMISEAGGTAPKAGREYLISHRSNPTDVRKVFLSKDEEEQMDANVEVIPGDTIVVTKAPIIYVVGDVRLPGGFVVDKGSGLTILQALALAQGATSTASLNNSKIIHKAGGSAQETPVPLKKILEGKAKDVKLQGDDILFVPHSAGKAAAMRGMEAALQAATGAAIYHF
jgi:polysaccharide export outer membrane protein